MREDNLKLIKEGLVRYVVDGIVPGSFLTAVIEDKFKEAVVRADENSLSNIRSIALLVYNALPTHCHGSHSTVNEWSAMGGMRGEGASQDLIDMITRRIMDFTS